jgi:hypothetical protein
MERPGAFRIAYLARRGPENLAKAARQWSHRAQQGYYSLSENEHRNF